ncbi:MAG TPA: tetratricopeptide repeat protein [Pyrinomonadaceae bacterium]|jgi:tetratricopeptide (TPR) repeat protein
MERPGEVYKDGAGHLEELLERLSAIPFISLTVNFIALGLSNWIVLNLYLFISRWGAIQLVEAALTLTDRLLWAGLFALLAFHYLLTFHTVAYVFPGLYPEEKRMVMVPLVWVYLAPVVAFVLMLLCSQMAVRLDLIEPLSPGAARAWLVRSYLVALLTTSLLSIPRRKWTLSFYGYLALLVFIWLLPNHFFDTLILALVEFCVILLAVTTAVRIIFKRQMALASEDEQQQPSAAWSGVDPEYRREESEQPWDADTREKIEEYTKALEANPKDAAAYTNRAMARASLGQYDLAVEDFSKAMEIDPDNIEAVYQCARARSLLGQYDLALEGLTKTLEAGLELGEAHFSRARIYYRLGREELAIKDFTSALEHLEDASMRANAYAKRGQVHYDLGHYEQAIEDFTEALKFDESNWDVSWKLRQAQEKLAELENAEADSSRAGESQEPL